MICFGQPLRPSSGSFTIIFKAVYCVTAKNPDGGVTDGRNMSAVIKWTYSIYGFVSFGK